MAIGRTRFMGLVLAGLVMAAAAGALLVNGDTAHALVPAAVLVLLVLAGVIERRWRPA